MGKDHPELDSGKREKSMQKSMISPENVRVCTYGVNASKGMHPGDRVSSSLDRELKEEGVEMVNCKCRCQSDPSLFPHVPSFCYNGTQASNDLCHHCTAESFLCRSLKKIRYAGKRGQRD